MKKEGGGGGIFKGGTSEEGVDCSQGRGGGSNPPCILCTI